MMYCWWRSGGITVITPAMGSSRAGRVKWRDITRNHRSWADIVVLCVCCFISVRWIIFLKRGLVPSSWRAGRWIYRLWALFPRYLLRHPDDVVKILKPLGVLVEKNLAIPPLLSISLEAPFHRKTSANPPRKAVCHQRAAGIVAKCFRANNSINCQCYCVIRTIANQPFFDMISVNWRRLYTWLQPIADGVTWRLSIKAQRHFQPMTGALIVGKTGLTSLISSPCEENKFLASGMSRRRVILMEQNVRHETADSSSLISVIKTTAISTNADLQRWYYCQSWLTATSALMPSLICLSARFCAPSLQIN